MSHRVLIPASPERIAAAGRVAGLERWRPDDQAALRAARQDLIGLRAVDHLRHVRDDLRADQIRQLLRVLGGAA